jgi:hypothetical protein
MKIITVGSIKSVHRIVRKVDVDYAASDSKRPNKSICGVIPKLAAGSSVQSI